MSLSEPVSYHVKQKLTRVLSVFHATPVSVPITDLLDRTVLNAMRSRVNAKSERETSQGKDALAAHFFSFQGLHGTICNDDFHGNTALQCWNNVVTIRNNVATMLQRCVALKIIIANRLV